MRSINNRNLKHYSPAYRPDQLNLPDDPAFFPDFDMTLDLSMFDISSEVSGSSSSVTPPSLLSSYSVMRDPVPEPVLILTPTDTAAGSGFGGFRFRDTSPAPRTASRTDRVSAFEDTGMVEDPGFEYDFDAEGNLIEHPTAGAREHDLPSATSLVRRPGSELAISAEVRQGHVATPGLGQVRLDRSFTRAGS
jgi:hypothetical protein